MTHLDPTRLPDVHILEPRVFSDERGFFYESFNAAHFAEATGLAVDFVQDNHSRSIKGVLRGIHYQLPPAAQGKLVRVVEGRVFDVAVDIRRSSATFGQWVGVELSAENHKQLWVPPGFGHAFLALTDPVQLLYKTTDYYAREYDRAIRWDDPDLDIAWPLDGATPLLSDKDAVAPFLGDAEVFA
jgi:dTDP-4-dehydrorhamnose 3,5-epimerase